METGYDHFIRMTMFHVPFNNLETFINCKVVLINVKRLKKEITVSIDKLDPIHMDTFLNLA